MGECGGEVSASGTLCFIGGIGTSKSGKHDVHGEEDFGGLDDDVALGLLKKDVISSLLHGVAEPDAAKGKLASSN